MKYDGTITRIQRGRGSVTLIVETDMGLRGVELDRDLWAQVVADFDIGAEDDIVGWGVEYDPAHGDLTIIGPEEDESGEEGSADDSSR